MDFTDKQRTIPVEGSYDVVVIGGGTAGAFAAIAAAKEGKKVIIVEQFGSLGGSATVGLVCPVMHTHIDGNPTCSYISKQVVDRLIELGGCKPTWFPNPTNFDPMLLKIVLEEMCCESGVKVLFHTFFSDAVVEDGAVRGIIVENKGGRQVIEGKFFIDCTGDGDVCVRAGAGYTHGNPESGKNQPVSLRYIIGGIDLDRYAAFMQKVCDEEGSSGCDPSQKYAAVTGTGKWTFTALFDKAIENGDLVNEDKLYWQSFTVPGRNDSLAFNNPEFFDLGDATDPEGLSDIQLMGKKAIVRQLRFYKKYFEGFENAYIAEIAGMVGIRESRNVTTDYVLTGEDLLSKKKFADAFCVSNYPVDIHGRTLKCDTLPKIVDDGRPYYEIPLRSLFVKGFENLMVAGRCMGAEFLAQSSLRVMHSVRASGEAAGIAAAMALTYNVPLRKVNGSAVRGRMIELGADFGKDYRA